MKADTAQMRQLAGRFTTVGDSLARVTASNEAQAGKIASPQNATTTTAVGIPGEAHRVTTVLAQRLLMIADHATTSATRFETVDGDSAADLRRLGV